jgi:hypothetical protein
MLLMTRMYKRWIDESVSGRPPALIYPPLILIHAWNGHEGGGEGGDVFFQVNNRLHCKAILHYMYVCIREQGLYKCVGNAI